MKILMVCLGNICRSPLAEGILRKRVEEKGLKWEVDSAATESYHIGNAPFHFSQQIAEDNGIDISKLRARRFNKKDLDDFDMIYVMAEDVYGEMLELVPEIFGNPKVKLLLKEFPSSYSAGTDVFDPYYGGKSGFQKVYEILEEACEKIVKKYSTP